MATLIGLCLKVKLLRSLPRRFKIDVAITPGTHASEPASQWMDAFPSVLLVSLSRPSTSGLGRWFIGRCLQSVEFVRKAEYSSLNSKKNDPTLC